MLASLSNSNIGWSLRGTVLHTAIFSKRALRHHRTHGVRRIGGLKHFSSVTRACRLTPTPTDQSAAAARLLDRFWQVRRSDTLTTGHMIAVYIQALLLC